MRLAFAMLIHFTFTTVFDRLAPMSSSEEVVTSTFLRVKLSVSVSY